MATYRVRHREITVRMLHIEAETRDKALLKVFRHLGNGDLIEPEVTYEQTEVQVVAEVIT